MGKTKWLRRIEVKEVSKSIKLPTIIIKDKKIEHIVNAWNWGKEQPKTRLAKALLLAGINPDSKITLYNYDKHTRFFEYSDDLNETTKENKICLLNGDYFEDFPIIKIKNDHITKTYECMEYTNPALNKIELKSYVQKNTTNNTNLSKYFNNWTYRITLEDDKNEFIFVATTKDDKVQKFMIENEEELAKYLYDLTFPIESVKVWAKILELSINDLSAFDEVKLSIIMPSKVDSHDFTITDQIIFKNDKFEKFIVTKNGITLSIEDDYTWSYKSKNVSISQNGDGIINYNLSSLTSKEIAERQSPVDEIAQISSEVEEFKKLRRSVINN